MATLEPELWVDRADRAVDFYARAFGATVLHQVGEGQEIVVQLALDGARFWVSSADPGLGRHSPTERNGATGRTLLVTEEPDLVVGRAIEAGATQKSPVSEEHGWLLGRIIDPFGHEWEIGKPIGSWPPLVP
jgi:PhnB protein